MRFSLGNPIGTPFDVCCSEFAHRNSGKLQGFTIHTNCNSSQGKKKSDAEFVYSYTPNLLN